MALRLMGKAPERGAADRRYYLLDVQEGYRRVRLSTGTRDKALALRKEQAVLDALREDIDVPDDVLRELVRGRARSVAAVKAAAARRTLRDAMDEALADRNGWGGLRSVDSVATNCRIICNYLGEDQAVAAITQPVVDDLAERMDAVYAPATTNRKMHTLLSLLRREKKRGHYQGDIPEYKMADERDNARTFVLSVEEEEMILANVLKWDTLPDPEYGGRPRNRDGKDYHALFVFLADVGCRLSQALTLRWADLREERGQLYVRFWRHSELKGGRPRTLPLTSRAAEVILARKKAHGKDEGPFTMLNKTRASKLWRRAIRGTHLEREKECVIHSLRHTCATRLLQATGNIKLVQEWLGHRDIRTTSEVYAKVLAEAAMEGASALENLRGETQVTPKSDITRQVSIAIQGVS